MSCGSVYEKGIVMKLPEYDSRPAPGTPLYDDPSDKGEAEDIKFGILGITLPLGMLFCWGAFLVLLLLAIFN
jgi:hypothetical protein